MKKRGDHSINRPGAWTHSEQGVEEVLLCQPHQEHFTEKSMEGNYMEKKEIVRQIHVRLEFLSIKNLKLVLSFIIGQFLHVPLKDSLESLNMPINPFLRFQLSD